ncbi:MAG TPA: hypothetical protein VN688_21780 [Gemmataceae bacterium]|nr:hypothetical protein [Gemmataceae bacterium]
MAPKSQGESKQGLIITLVFFILATIGLGVSTYFGFAEQEKMTKDVTAAKNDAKLFKEQRDWYLFQDQMYRSYMGKAQNLEGAADLPTKKAQFDQGVMKGDKDKEDVTKVLKELEKDLGWAGAKPKETYEERITKLLEQYETLEKRNQGLTANLAEAKKTIQKRDEELKTAQAEYQTNLAKFKKESATDQTSNLDAIKTARAEVEKVSAGREKDKANANEEKKTLLTQIDGLKKNISHLNGLVKSKQEQIEQYEVKSTEAPASMRTDWKIVKMDTRGTNPYINLGSADKVKPQLTFSIHGVGLDGRPIPQPKGTLEVVNVVSEHLSRTRITSVKDANRDPILEGDVLYNPSWNPTIKKHVALAGLMDLTGDGRDSIAEFIRSLERQNIVVDAWLDPKDGSVKGKGITLQTDYLILGDTREKADNIQNIRTGRANMEEKAVRNGVKRIALYKYLEMIGYRLPRSTGAERRSLYDPTLRPDKAPRLGDKKPPVMPPNK